MMFDYWILVTKQIFDFRGDEQNEVYLTVQPAKITDGSAASITWNLPQSMSDLDENKLVFRLLERQHIKLDANNSTQDWSWDSILSDSNNDAEARITRISPPIKFQRNTLC